MAKKDSIRRLTPLAVLKDLVKVSTACRDRAQRASGQLGQAIKDAAEHKHLNPGAFKMVMQLCRIGEKDPVKLAFFLEDFDHYREQLKIDDMKAEKLPGLDADDEEETDAAPKGGRLEPLRAAAKKSTEAVKKSAAVMEGNVTDLAAARAKNKKAGPKAGK